MDVKNQSSLRINVKAFKAGRSLYYDLIRCAQTNVNYFPLKIT